MKKATGQLLKYLQQPNPKAFVVNVKPLGFDAAKKNHCFENMMRFLDENEDWVLRSGWLVGDYFGENGTAVMPHYWVHNPEDKQDYDVTPIEDTQNFEYILDIEVAKHQDWDRLIGIPVSLKLNSDGTLSARTGENSFKPIDKIDYKTLYRLVD